MATLTVVRDGKPYGGLRKVKIMVDNNDVGAVGRSSSMQVPIAPGHHVLYVKMDWARSPELAFVVGDRDVTIDIVMPGVFEGTWKSFLQPRSTFGVVARP